MNNYEKIKNMSIEEMAHQALMRIFWRISKYLLTKLSIPDIHNLEEEIVTLERIYEEDFEEKENDRN